MSRPPSHRLPVEPLTVAIEAAIAGREIVVRPARRENGTTHCFPEVPARWLHDRGINRRRYMRWQAEGGIPWPSADRIATDLLGTHPALIWGDDWFWDMAELEVGAQ